MPEMSEQAAQDGCQIAADVSEKIDEIIDKYKGKPGSLIPVLQETQELIGYLPGVVQRYIAKGLNIPAAQVYGVVTFYSFFTMVPRGKHTLRVCLGTACYVRGGKKSLDTIQKELGVDVGSTTEDLKYSLEMVRCLGACGLAPVMVIDEDVHRRIKPANVMKLIKEYD